MIPKLQYGSSTVVSKYQNYNQLNLTEIKVLWRSWKRIYKQQKFIYECWMRTTVTEYIDT